MAYKTSGDEALLEPGMFLFLLGIDAQGYN